ncbi:MAG: GC-type dockerin domain-anchored protein [Phycisphaerales bacterium]
MSGDGLVVAGNSRIGSGRIRAIRWTSTEGMLDLGTLPDGLDSYANGISVDGAVIVGMTVYSSSTEAFRWTASTGMVGLGFLPDGIDSWATDANADGSVIVGLARNSDGRLVATKWTASDGMVTLGTLAGDTGSYAGAVSADGQIVVGDSTLPGGPHAFLWTNTTGMVDLNTYLPTLGIDLTGWTLRSASGISPNGLHITGQGIHNGRDEAWIATVTPPCAPDLNGDAVVNSQDFFAYLGFFFGGLPQADFNHDGSTTSQDFFDFLAAFFTGC